MLKILIILALTVYVISKIGSFFFRAGFSSSQTRYQQQTRSNGHRTQPNPPARKERKNGAIKGGEYVDYEEVK